jgi:hypothetical protein
MKIVFIFFAAICFCYAQDSTLNEQEFFSNIKNSYYSLESTEKKNFTTFLTNISTETFAFENWKNSEIFPVQLIWFSPDRLFLSEQGYPALNDSLKIKYREMVSELKTQFQDILLNLRRFYFSGIYKSISQDYKIRTIENIVEVSFSTVTREDTVASIYYFGKNGLCLKIITHSKVQNLTEEIIPQFRIIKTKWLILNWKVQLKRNDVIEAGYLIELNNSLIEDIWVPSDIIITVQQSEIMGRTFQDVIKIRNYLFNQPLQFINNN